MKRTKKMLALALTASMVLGSASMAFAEDAPATSGNTEGTGAVEGHVDKEVINVVLPTVASGSSLFSYTMDPERLIQGTSAAKYAEGAEFPAAGSDTGVYFLTGTNKYANTSNAYQVINKSSCDVELTVKVKTEAGTSDIALATTNTVATTGTPNLYLGLKVGEGSAATVLKADEQTINKRISGSAGNFDVAVKTKEDGTKEYVYQAKQGADATGWKAMNISMEGAVSALPIDANTTAPKVQVTWEYKKADDNTPAVNTSEEVEYKVTGPQISVSSSGLITITALTATKKYKSLAIEHDGETTAVGQGMTWNTDNLDADTGAGDCTIQLSQDWMKWLGGKDITVKLTLSDDSVVSASTTLD